MKNAGNTTHLSAALLPSVMAGLIIMTLALSASASDEGRAGKGYLEIGGGYKTGDFDTGVRSNLYYLGPTVGYVSPSWDAGITAPFLYLSNRAKPQSGISNINTMMAGGIGDVIARAGRVLVPEGKAGFSLDGALALKFPTARASEGLGTGETDYGAFAGVRQRIGRFRFSFFGGYIKVGDQAGLDYHDTPLYGVGISGVFGRTSLLASFEGRRSLIPGTLNPQEVNLGMFRVLSRNLALKAGTFFGLNKGGPDFGLSAGFVRFF